MSAKRRVILYRRVSTNDQGLGLAAQLETLEVEASRRDDWTLEYVTDEGVSGSVPAGERENLGPALRSLGAGDVLCVAKLDRLSRSVLDFATLLRRAGDEGWGIVVLDMGIDMTTPNGKLVAHMLMAIAEWEREMISTRIREGMAQSTKRLGRQPGLPPVMGARPAHVPDTVIAFVLDQSREGTSPRLIADRLNTYGHASPRGKRWHHTTVRRLLTRLATAP